MDNPRIIHAPINTGRRYGITSPITQYDYGYLLLPEGVELPTIYEIDFSNDEKHGTSFTVYGNSEGAEVPEVLIRTGKDVFAFYYEVGEGYGKTEYTWRIPNNCRPSRDGQTPTPTQQSSIDQLIVRSNEAVESAEQSASDASASAQSAQGYASQAETAKSDAQTYANNAQASATSASQSAQASAKSATASAQSASQSAQIKSDVEDLVDDARGYASASAQSATASANSASQASGYAQSASASAQSASQYASSAQTSANTASAKAQDASGYAQTASTKASESAQSATNAQGYAQTAEQAKTASQTAQGLAESARDLAQGYAEDAQGYANDAQASAEGISASASQIAQNTANILKAFPTDTASGSIASFSDGADDLPLKSLVVNIDPIQDLSNGDPSPENICPISGWTEVNVNHSGADMTNPTTLTIQLGQTVYGGKLDVLSGELVINRAMVDLGTLNWYVPYNPAGIIAYNADISVIPSALYSNPHAETDILCEKYKTCKYNDITAGREIGVAMFGSGDARYIRIFAPEYANKTATEIKADLSGVKLIYTLLTPIEIQLSPNHINSLLGANNIWADSGDTTAEYRADTRLYVAKKIAEAISALT